MKIAIFSDVHCHVINLESFLKKVQKEANLIYCLGDTLGYSYEIDATIKLFKKYNVMAIKGNHEKYALDELKPSMQRNSLNESINNTKKFLTEESRQYFKMMPDKLYFENEGSCLFLNHGDLYDPERYLYQEEASNYFQECEKIIKNPERENYFFFGHTHLPYWEKKGNVVIANPGSLGYPKGGHSPSFILLDLSKGMKASNYNESIIFLT